MTNKPLSQQVAIVTGGGTGIGRAFINVENTKVEQQPRAGFIHVANMARTLMYVLPLDRNVVVEDVSIYGR